MYRKPNPKTPQDQLDKARERARLKRLADGGPTQEYMVAYRARHAEHLKGIGRSYQQRHALRINLRRKGLSLEDYRKVVEVQGDTCAICGGPPGGRWRKYNIDHCHKTGRLRGLLCKNCNTGIGMFRDNPELLRTAALYLKAVSKLEETKT